MRPCNSCLSVSDRISNHRSPVRNFSLKDHCRDPRDELRNFHSSLQILFAPRYTRFAQSFKNIIRPPYTAVARPRRCTGKFSNLPIFYAVSTIDGNLVSRKTRTIFEFADNQRSSLLVCSISVLIKFNYSLSEH